MSTPKEWANKIMASQSIILDTETTGLEGVVVQIAITSINGEVLLDSLVQPLMPVEAGARSVHGLSDEQLANAPTWAEVWPRVKTIIEAADYVVVYNATFDHSIIERTNRRAGINYQLRRFECAMLQWAAHYGEWDQRRQSWKWQRLNGGHSALSDCQAALERVKTMAAG